MDTEIGDNMNGIKKEVYVLREALKSKINYSEGTTIIPIELHVADFILPEDSAAVVYSLAAGMSKPKKLVAEIKNNTVIFTPEGDFLKKGINIIQVRIVSGTQTLVMFKETVECKEKMDFDDAGEIEIQKTLIEQLLEKMSECLSEIQSSEQRITEKIEAEANARSETDVKHDKKIGSLEKKYNERVLNEEELKLVTEVGKIVDAILIKKLNEDINTTNESLSNLTVQKTSTQGGWVVEKYVNGWCKLYIKAQVYRASKEQTVYKLAFPDEMKLKNVRIQMTPAQNGWNVANFYHNTAGQTDDNAVISEAVIVFTAKDTTALTYCFDVCVSGFLV